MYLVFSQTTSSNQLDPKTRIRTRWTAHVMESMENFLGLRIKHRLPRRSHQSDAARALTKGQNVYSMRQKRRAPCSHIGGFVGPVLRREQSDALSAERRVAVEVSGHTNRRAGCYWWGRCLPRRNLRSPPIPLLPSLLRRPFLNKKKYIRQLQPF